MGWLLARALDCKPSGQGSTWAWSSTQQGEGLYDVISFRVNTNWVDGRCLSVSPSCATHTLRTPMAKVRLGQGARRQDDEPFVHASSGSTLVQNSSEPVSPVPAGSLLRGGDVTVYVYDINQPSLPLLYRACPLLLLLILILCLFLSLWPFQLHFIP